MAYRDCAYLARFTALDKFFVAVFEAAKRRKDLGVAIIDGGGFLATWNVPVKGGVSIRDNAVAEDMRNLVMLISAGLMGAWLLDISPQEAISVTSRGIAEYLCRPFTCSMVEVQEVTPSTQGWVWRGTYIIKAGNKLYACSSSGATHRVAQSLLWGLTRVDGASGNALPIE